MTDVWTQIALARWREGIEARIEALELERGQPDHSEAPATDRIDGPVVPPRPGRRETADRGDGE